MKGLVAFSFGKRKNELDEPCISNVDLALEVRRILNVLPESPLIAAQWEVANVLRKFGIIPHLEIWEHRKEGEYLDSDEVMASRRVF